MNARAEGRGLVPPTRPANFGPPDFLRTMVTNPRATMRWVLDHGDGGLWFLLLVGSILSVAAALIIDMHRVLGSSSDGIIAETLSAIRVAITNNAPQVAWMQFVGLWFGFGFPIVLCAIGATYLVVGSGMIGWVLGGAARPLETVRAIAWGGLPLAAALPFVLASGLFDPLRAPTPFLLLRMVGVVAALGTAWVTIATFAEAQRFTRWQAAVALLLAFGVAYGLGLLVAPLMPFPIHSIIDTRTD